MGLRSSAQLHTVKQLELVTGSSYEYSYTFFEIAGSEEIGAVLDVFTIALPGVEGWARACACARARACAHQQGQPLLAAAVVDH